MRVLKKCHTNIIKHVFSRTKSDTLYSEIILRKYFKVIIKCSWSFVIIITFLALKYCIDYSQNLTLYSNTYRHNKIVTFW